MSKCKIAILFIAASIGLTAQITFDPKIKQNEFPWNPHTVIVPESPLKLQVLFVGGVDKVQTTDTYGNPAGETVAKQWHDFIGFTPAKQGETGLGWISVNHEMVIDNDMIGDGGGMTVFKVERAKDGTLNILNQTLSDGRKGKFFNVDFVNTVGETGMNCGGIVSEYDGRIWTAEEWFREDNASLLPSRDTNDFTIGESTPAGFPGLNGQSIKKYQNFNYMVEIDPRQAKAIRKQYNWGRQAFEGGCILPDNKTVYICEDNTPGLFTKFVADVAGDFTKGKTYVFKQNPNSFKGEWVEVQTDNMEKVVNFGKQAFENGGTGFNRLEWITYNLTNGKIYFTETGRDNPGSGLAKSIKGGGDIAFHHKLRALKQNNVSVEGAEYVDYYGRILEYDPTTSEVKVYLEGGPDFPDIKNPYSFKGDYVPYPEKHLSNPDGLSTMYVGDKTFLVIQEDLNGTSYGRVPPTVVNSTCELYILDMSKEPKIENLIRIGIVPIGAEVTGAKATPDGKTLLVNSQHPSGYNEYPFNNSLTFAIHGWDELITTGVENIDIKGSETGFRIFPNPTSRSVSFDKVMDIAIYDINGNRISVSRNVNSLDIRDLIAGTYFLKNDEGKVSKLIVQ